MKNILLLFILFISTFIKSQSITIDIEKSPLGQPKDYYRKDGNNLLDPFQGTYVFSSGDAVFKIVLKKMIKQSEGLHFQDMIIGEYQYIKNGVEKVNTLSNLDIVYPDQFSNHGIAGSSVIWNNSRLWKCPQCNPDEKRLRTVIKDKVSGRSASLLMRRTTINGQEVMQIKIQGVSSEIINVDNPGSVPAFILPVGELTMIKQ